MPNCLFEKLCLKHDQAKIRTKTFDEETLSRFEIMALYSLL